MGKKSHSLTLNTKIKILLAWWVKKRHSLTLNTKIRTTSNYTDGIGTGYTSHDNEMCLHSKDLKTTLKSINQIWHTDAVIKHVRGRVKNWWFFSPKTSYKLGTGVKRGEQVGFFIKTQTAPVHTCANSCFCVTQRCPGQFIIYSTVLYNLKWKILSVSE